MHRFNRIITSSSSHGRLAQQLFCTIFSSSLALAAASHNHSTSDDSSSLSLQQPNSLLSSVISAPLSSLKLVVGPFLMTSACDGSLTNSNMSNSSNSNSNSSSSKKRALNLTSVPTVVLYQYKICPYCNRVKAILEFLGIEYTAIEVNPLTKSELSAFTYKKVPIATINGEVITESKVIIERLISFIEANDKKTEFFVIDSDRWAEWSDRRLAVYLYPNLTSTLKSSYESFGYTVDVAAWNAPWAFITRVASSLAMWAASGKIKSKYDIKDEQKELDIEIQVWLAALGNNKFLHGDSITMPDLLVFGVIKAVDGLSVQDKMFSRFPQLKRWYFDVKAEMR